MAVRNVKPEALHIRIYMRHLWTGQEVARRRCHFPQVLSVFGKTWRIAPAFGTSQRARRELKHLFNTSLNVIEKLALIDCILSKGL
jgi:hypothetical protein